MNLFRSKPAETVVLSVGGSLVVPGEIDVDFLKKLNTFVRKQIKETNRKFIIVIGGGKTARVYRDGAKDVVGEITNDDLDWIGIHATRLNAHLVRTIFQDIAHPRIVENYDKPNIHSKEPVIIGAGWKPGWSTDYCAALLAMEYKASVIINLSNIDYVYDKDPNKYKDAKPLKHTTWEHFENLIPSEWVPGTNAPFDPVASRLAKSAGSVVIVANGKKFANLSKILNGEEFVGTMITNHKIDSTFYDQAYFEEKKGEYRMAHTNSTIGSFIQNLANMYRALWIKLVLNPRNCLDVGCGTGKLVYYLRKLGIQAFGVDVSEYAISAAPKEVRPFLKHSDITKIPYDDGEFDLVISFDVMEHIARSKIKNSALETVRVSRKYVLHKIYTIENTWIDWTHKQDFSHLSVQSQAFWINLFRSIDAVSITKKFYFRLPSFFESVFLLKKKSTSDVK